MDKQSQINASKEKLMKQLGVKNGSVGSLVSAMNERDSELRDKEIERNKKVKDLLAKRNKVAVSIKGLV